MKNYLGECNLKVTRPNGEWSEILVSNPVKPSEITAKRLQQGDKRLSSNHGLHGHIKLDAYFPHIQL